LYTDLYEFSAQSNFFVNPEPTATAFFEPVQ
jgi:hypothetical protein